MGPFSDVLWLELILESSSSHSNQLGKLLLMNIMKTLSGGGGGGGVSIEMQVTAWLGVLSQQVCMHLEM